MRGQEKQEHLTGAVFRTRGRENGAGRSPLQPIRAGPVQVHVSLCLCCRSSLAQMVHNAGELAGQGELGFVLLPRAPLVLSRPQAPVALSLVEPLSAEPAAAATGGSRSRGPGRLLAFASISMAGSGASSGSGAGARVRAHILGPGSGIPACGSTLARVCSAGACLLAGAPHRTPLPPSAPPRGPAGCPRPGGPSE